MKGGAGTSVQRRFRSVPGFLFGVMLLALGSSALGFTLTVVDGNDDPIQVGYRWLLEEDTTNLVRPGVPSTTSISVSIGTSYSIPVATGTDNDLSRLNNPAILNPAKRYVLTVLPDQPPEGPSYTMSAAKLAAGQNSATVKVLSHPVPTAQISVLVFMDNAFINGRRTSRPSRVSGLQDPAVRPGRPDGAGRLREPARDDLSADLRRERADPGPGPATALDRTAALRSWRWQRDLHRQHGERHHQEPVSGEIRHPRRPDRQPVVGPDLDDRRDARNRHLGGRQRAPTFVEAGFFNVHAFIGFVHPSNDPQTGQPLDYGPKFLSPEGPP